MQFTDKGICKIDIYRALGDFNDTWDIVPVSEDRTPNASYGGGYRVPCIRVGHVEIARDHRGMYLYLDGELIGSACY